MHDLHPLDGQNHVKDALLSMRVFVRVVEAGSLARAADTLGLLRPAATRHIQALEERLRTRLLNRTTRRLSVTPAGSVYYEQVVRLLGDLDQIESDFSEARQSVRRRIRVDMPAALARLVILPALPAFLAHHRDVRVDVSIGERLPDLRAENVDLALRIGAVSAPSVLVREVGQIPFVTVASPDYLSQHGLPRHPDELRRNGHQMLGAFLSDSGQRPPASVVGTAGARVNGGTEARLRIEDATSLADAARAGAGVTRLPHFLAARFLASGELIAILTDWPIAPLPLHIVTLPGPFRAPALSVFEDWITERLAGNCLRRESEVARDLDVSPHGKAMADLGHGHLIPTSSTRPWS